MINDLIDEHVAFTHRLVIDSGLLNYTPVGNDEFERSDHVSSLVMAVCQRFADRFAAVLATLPKDSVEHWDFCLAHLEVGDVITEAHQRALRRCEAIAIAEQWNAECQRIGARECARQRRLACKDLKSRAMAGAEGLKREFAALQGDQQ